MKTIDVNCKGKEINAGWFSTPEEARKAYELKHVEVFGEYSPYFNK